MGLYKCHKVITKVKLQIYHLSQLMSILSNGVCCCTLFILAHCLFHFFSIISRVGGSDSHRLVRGLPGAFIFIARPFVIANSKAISYETMTPRGRSH